jgi:hypothetical protein
MHLEWTLKSHQEWHWLIEVMHRPHASHGTFVTTCGRCERWQQCMLLNMWKMATMHVVEDVKDGNNACCWICERWQQCMLLYSTMTCCWRCERWQQWVQQCMLLEDDLLGIIFCPINSILPRSIFQQTLESSNHPSCRGHSSPLSLTFIFISYLHVEVTFIMKLT